MNNQVTFTACHCHGGIEIQEYAGNTCIHKIWLSENEAKLLNSALTNVFTNSNSMVASMNYIYH